MAILSNFQANGQEAIKVAPPSQSGTLTYTGSEQSPSWTTYKTQVITITSTPQTNAGNYTATAALATGYVWADTLKSGQRTLPWTIGPASGGTIALSKNVVELGEEESDTITATITGTGDTVTAVSSNSSVATVSVSGTTITITDGGTEGTATITVSASGNYVYASSVSIAVSVSYMPDIVTWADGTDAQIVAMCQASDQGKLDLHDCWNIGDERTVHLSAMAASYAGESYDAQDVSLVIVDNKGYQTTSSTTSSFIVQQKKTLGKFGYMNSSAFTSVANTKWGSTDRRNWCNNTYKNAMPSTIRGIFKQVKVHYGIYEATSDEHKIFISDDYFFFPSVRELVAWDSATSAYGPQTISFYESRILNQWEYYKTPSNIIKYISNQAARWWTRSASGSNYFVYVNSDGTFYNGQANSAVAYIAPAGCIGTANHGEGIIVPSWEFASDDEIINIISKADAGEIDLSNYWNIGDRRAVSLSAMDATGVGESHVAQTVYFVLMDANNSNYEYVTPTSGRTYCNFVVQQEDVLMLSNKTGEFGYIDTNNGQPVSWDTCPRRTWCNSVYYNSIPSNIRSIFKQVKVKSAETYNGNTIKISNDYFFLPAEREVVGSRNRSNSTEYNSLKQWDRYTNQSYRIKYTKNGQTNKTSWFLRSADYQYYYSWCRIVDYQSDGENKYGSLGIAPCGCI